MSGGVTVRWGTERVRFEEAADGDQWRRIRKQWTGCAWRRRGVQVIDDLEIEADADVVDEVVDT